MSNLKLLAAPQRERAVPATSRRTVLRCLFLLACAVATTPGSARAFAAIRERARGGTVHLNAWGGAPEINAYLGWAGGQLAARFGIELVHVKLGDTGEAVSRVIAEKAAGRMEGGSIDLIWINGENFRTMRERNLLFGPFAQRLPSFAAVDVEGKPTTVVDFGLPTDGFESPWGMAQFVMFHDTAVLPEPPRTLAALAAHAEANPGRITYPAAANFLGATFLEQLLYATIEDRASLARPVAQAVFDEAAGGVWSWLDRVRPHLWRGGTTYPASGPAMHQLLADGEIDVSMAFNPAEASTLIAQGRLPDSVRSFVLDGGSIANSHFLAIPFNATSPDAAMVVADFLLSPEAQARKQDPAVWGDPTVLDLDKLSAADRALFTGQRLGVATLAPDRLGPQLAEPHPSWRELLEAGWARRYAA